jgi:HAE1 family hydrophobic/amphiphilic exporter-1
LRPAFAGIDVGDWVDPQGETRDVRVRFAPESRRSAADLSTVPLVLQTPTGEKKTVPLGTIASIVEGKGPAQIDHLDRGRVISVDANTRDLPLSEVMKGIQKKLDAYKMPPGYGVIQGGDVESQKEVFGRMGAALAASILLMYLILVVQFGSFLDPISILVSLPLSLIGVMLALLLTGSTVNLMSLIGVTLLMGIVAKNAILLIDFAKWAVEKGVPRQQAIIEAGRTRLRPILMTSVAIVAGMLPVAIGGGEGADFRAPLGRAVIGGVITSTLLSLLVIPTLYDMFSAGATAWRSGSSRSAWRVAKRAMHEHARRQWNRSEPHPRSSVERYSNLPGSRFLRANRGAGRGSVSMARSARTRRAPRRRAEPRRPTGARGPGSPTRCRSSGRREAWPSRRVAVRGTRRAGPPSCCGSSHRGW